MVKNINLQPHYPGYLGHLGSSPWLKKLEVIFHKSHMRTARSCVSFVRVILIKKTNITKTTKDFYNRDQLEQICNSIAKNAVPPTII